MFTKISCNMLLYKQNDIKCQFVLKQFSHNFNLVGNMRKILIGITIFIALILGGIFFIWQMVQTSEKDEITISKTNQEENIKLETIDDKPKPDLELTNKLKVTDTTEPIKEKPLAQAKEEPKPSSENKQQASAPNSVITKDLESFIKSVEKASKPKSEKITLKFILQKSNENKQELILDIPLQTQTGKTGDINYQTILEKNSFLVNWDAIGWYFDGTHSASNYLIQGHQLKIFNVDSAPESLQIILKPCYTLELTFMTPDGSTIPDGTIASIEGNLTGQIYQNQSVKTIQNQKLSLYFRESEVINFDSITIDKYFCEPFSSEFQENLICKKILPLKEQIKTSITLLNEQNQPLENYYIYLYDRIISTDVFIDFRNLYINKKEILTFLNKPVYKTNELGKIEYYRIRSGNFNCYIIGENAFGRRHHFSLALNETEKTIIIKTNSAKINISVFDGDTIINKKIVTYIYRDEFYWDNFYYPDGNIKLWGLRSGPLHISLTVDSYSQKDVLIDVPESGVLETKVQLKPEGIINIQLVDNEGKNLEKSLPFVVRNESNNYNRLVFDSNEKGFLEIKNLDPDLIYTIKTIESKYSVSETFKNELKAQPEILKLPIAPPKTVLINTTRFDNKKIDLIVLSLYKPGKKQYYSRLFYGSPIEIDLEKNEDVDIGVYSPGTARFRKTYTKDFLQNLSTPIEIQLEKGFDVNAKILDNKRLPIAATKIGINDYYPIPADCVVGVTNEEGNVIIPNCQVGDFFCLSHPKHPFIKVKIEEKHKTEPLEYTMEASYQTTGVLKNQKGEALGNIQIICTHRGTRRSLYTTTDSLGKFSLDTMTPGRWTFQFEILNVEGKKTWHDINIVDKNEQFEQSITVKEK